MKCLMDLKASLQKLLEGGIQRFHQDYHLSAPVTIDNPLGELIVETNYEIAEEVLSKVLINAWEAYDNKPADPRPISIHTHLVPTDRQPNPFATTLSRRGAGLDCGDP